MRHALAAAFASVIFATAALAASFPALTGRVVDGARILSARTEQSLTNQLSAHERQTTNQVVIVTVPSLGGQGIEEYGVALGRRWGIGQKGKNNGVLLIVAPNDRQVRIEVGYGLEGTLTDAMASTIVQRKILPEFRKGNLEAGVVLGTRSILGVLSGDAAMTQEVRSASPSSGSQMQRAEWVPLLLFLLIFTQARPLLALPAQLFSAVGLKGLKRMLVASALIPALWWLLPRYRFGGTGGGRFGGGGSSGSSFRGGGGSFGGGGSSGKW